MLLWDKPKPRFFITGSRGFLGHYLSAYFHKQGYYVFESHAFHLRIDNPSNLHQVLTRLKPDIIIHLAAYHRWDNPADQERALKVNVEGMANLLDIAEILQIPILFISSDQVFDGRKNLPYSEKDPINPLSFFGRLKIRGEEMIRNADLPAYWILRLSPVWSEDVHLPYTRQNFLAGIVRAFERNSREWPITVYGGLLHRKLVAKAIEGLFHQGKAGIYHIASDTEKSYFEQARYMAQFLGPSKELIADTIRASSPPPQNFRMNTEKISKAIDLTIPSFEDDVRKWLRKE
jgi:dTDP-4-dehydrorhamnose reductase